jgi:hypothetical protein
MIRVPLRRDDRTETDPVVGLYANASADQSTPCAFAEDRAADDREIRPVVTASNAASSSAATAGRGLAPAAVIAATGRRALLPARDTSSTSASRSRRARASRRAPRFGLRPVGALRSPGEQHLDALSIWIETACRLLLLSQARALRSRRCRRRASR